MDIRVKSVTEAGLGLSIPTYRVDVVREVDVIEEILRIYGYNNITVQSKLNASIAPTHSFENHKLQHTIGDYLAANGFMEIMSNSLSAPKYIEILDENGSEDAVEIVNPLGTELSIMRRSMLFTGLEAVIYNINRKRSDLRLFEFGKVYRKEENGHSENTRLGVFLTGNRHRESWVMADKKTDFFYLKSLVTNTLSRLGITETISAPVENPEFAEGLVLTANKKPLVAFGSIRKSISKAMGIKQDVLYAEFYWDELIKLVRKNTISYAEIPKYPEVKRDFALLLDEGIQFGKLHEVGMKTAKKLLKQIDLFDVYTGESLPKGKKSYAISFLFQDSQRTLTDKQIDKTMDRLKTKFEKDFGAELR